MWCKLRKKEVADTPEESVRQWFIEQLLAKGVPEGLMNCEVFLRLGSKPYRADILIFDRSGKPLAIVECKRRDVNISQAVVNQALRYHGALEVEFIYLTNGNNTYIYKRQGRGFVPCDQMPTYEEMLCRQ
jgi:type I site-specific restriction endonuclease